MGGAVPQLRRLTTLWVGLKVEGTPLRTWWLHACLAITRGRGSPGVGSDGGEWSVLVAVVPVRVVGRKWPVPLHQGGTVL